jgi:oligopeptidase B
MAGPEFSLDEQLMAYAVDLEGSEVYTLVVKNLTSGELLIDGGNTAAFSAEFRASAGDFVFMSDNRTVVFTTLTAATHRPDKVWWFDLDAAAAPVGKRPHKPQLLYHQPDERFHLGVWLSRSGALVYLQGGSDATQYLQYLPATASLSAGTNFTQLAPLIEQQQYIVRDWPLAGAERSSKSGKNGSSEGGGSDAAAASSGRYVYAVVYSAERRNGELVVAPLGPDALAGAAGGAQGSAPDANSTAGEAAAAPPPPAPGAAAANESSGNATLAPASAPSPAAAPAEPGSNATSGSGNATASGGNEGGSGSSNASSTSPLVVLQAHSWDVEIVDITVSSGHLAVLERRNGTLVATAYPLPKDGGWVWTEQWFACCRS